MPVTVVGIGTRGSKAGGTGTLVASKSITAGNTAVCGIAYNTSVAAAQQLATPSGWSVLFTQPTIGSGTYKPGVIVFYKVSAGGTETNTVTAIGTDFYGYSTIVEISNVSGAGVTTTNSSASLVTAGNSGTTATTTVADSITFAICTAETGGGGTGTFSTPASSGYTVIGTNPNDSAIIAYDFSYKILAATATQIASWTWTGSSAYTAGIGVFSGSGGGGGGRTLFMASGLEGLSTSGPKQFNPSLGYHRTPTISLEAYRREQALKHRVFMAKVRRAG